jgi:hypothetical protein
MSTDDQVNGLLQLKEVSVDIIIRIQNIPQILNGNGKGNGEWTE